MGEQGELVSLAEVIATAPADHEPVPGFQASLTRPLIGGQIAAVGLIKAVLERTAVVDLGADGTGLARIRDVLVVRAAVQWRRRTAPSRTVWMPTRLDADLAVQLAQQRAESDERARQDQQRREQAIASVPSVQPGGPDPRPDHGSGRPLPDQPSQTARRICRLGGRRQRRRAAADAQAGDGPASADPPTGGHGDEDLAKHQASAAAAQPEPREEEEPTVGADVAEDQRDEHVGDALGRISGGSAAASPPEGAGDDPEQRPRPRACERCGDPLRGNNRSGVCTACQLTCPSCGGRKAVVATRCFACRKRELAGEDLEVLDRTRPGTSARVVPNPTQTALSSAATLADLPGRIQDLLDQVVTLARYAQALEDELEAHRSAERQMQRLGRRALAALEGR